MLLALGTARAQPLGPSDGNARIDLSAIGLEAQQGLTKAGGITSRWVPVEVVVENRGKGGSVQLVVKLLPSGVEEGSIVVRRTVALPPGAQRREWFVLPINPAPTQLQVEVRELRGDDGKEGKLLRRIEPQLYHYAGYRQGDWSDAHVLYVTAEGGETWRRSQWLHSYGNQGLIGVRTPELLPDRALAYAGVDLVVLHDSDTRGMNEAQRGALEA